MRAIDAENIRIKPEFMHNVCGMAMIRVEDVVRILNEQPTIQLDIVRCEECLYRKICSWEKQGAKFCSFAERREETE